MVKDLKNDLHVSKNNHVRIYNILCLLMILKRKKLIECNNDLPRNDVLLFEHYLASLDFALV